MFDMAAIEVKFSSLSSLTSILQIARLCMVNMDLNDEDDNGSEERNDDNFDDSENDSDTGSQCMVSTITMPPKNAGVDVYQKVSIFFL